MKLLKNKGFKQFLVRCGIFFGILFFLMFFIFLFFSKTILFQEYLKIPTDFYFSILQGLNKQNFVNSAIFVVVAFLLWRRKEILAFKSYAQNYRESAVFGSLAFVFFIAHYALKYWIHFNVQSALEHTLFFTTLKLSLNLLFALFLGIAIFNLSFVKMFLQRFWKDIIVFTVILFLYYRLIWWFQDSWFFFSTIVGKTLGWVLPFFFDDVVVRLSADRGPILGVEGFFVAISKVCSGIDSLLFFISLFIILVITNWDNLNKKRMAILFIPGIFGAYMLNFIRVFLLLIIAVTYSPEFAIDTFHTNAGWILFLGYFILFWHFGSKWVLK